MKKINLILIFLAAFLIRLIAVDQSLWLDEATTARVAGQYGYLEIISKFSPTDFHPPLYYLFMKFWTGMFGNSEAILRLPSILFSLGAGYLLYLMGGIWAAVFFLFNPLVVYYSQEVRMYMMAVFFLTGGLHYFIKVCHPELIPGSRDKLGMRRTSHLIFFNVFLILAFYTFYGSIFLITAMVLYLVYKREYRVLIVSTMMFGAYAAVLSPLTLMQLKNSRVALQQVANWSQILGTANLKNLVLIPIKFSIGRIDFYPKWLYYAASSLWTVFVFGNLIRFNLKKVEPLWKTWFFLFVFPLFLGLIFSFFSPLLQYFRFIYLIPVLSLLLSFQADRRTRIQPVRLNWLLLAGFLFWSLVYLLLPQFHREDWKQTAAKIGGRLPVYMVVSSSDPMSYYARDIVIRDLKGLESAREKSLVVIPYTSDIHGIDYKKTLAEKRYRLNKTYSLRGLTYEEWVR